MQIDARGKNCPLPVIMTKKAIDAGEPHITILVDSEIPAQNVERLLKKSGYTSSKEAREGALCLKASREEGAAPSREKEASSSLETGQRPGKTALVLCKKILGGDDPNLGEVLMKGFIHTLAQRGKLPQTIVLMNEGVYLAEDGTTTAEDLQHMIDRGVELLVCGTCTNHFGITPKVTTGIISNMFDITEAIFQASRVISLP